jgi:Rrf2 family protein
MFRLTAQTAYAYLALLTLAERREKSEGAKLSEIVAERGLSEKFMLQVLTDLRRAGLVESRRGKNGGYLLSTRPEKITLADVIAATTGSSTSGGAGFEVVGEDCFLAGWWRSILDEIHQLSTKTTVADALTAETARTELMYHI